MLEQRQTQLPLNDRAQCTVRPLFANSSVFPSRSIFLVSLLGNYSSYLSIRSIPVAPLALTANAKAIPKLRNVSVAAEISSLVSLRQACTYHHKDDCLFIHSMPLRERERKNALFNFVLSHRAKASAELPKR